MRRGAWGRPGSAALFNYLCADIRARIFCVFSTDRHDKPTASYVRDEADPKSTPNPAARGGLPGPACSAPPSRSSCGQQRRRRLLRRGFSGLLAVQEEKREPIKPVPQPLTMIVQSNNKGPFGARLTWWPLALRARRSDEMHKQATAPSPCTGGRVTRRRRCPQPTLDDPVVMLLKINSSLTRSLAMAPEQAQPPAERHIAK